MREQSLYLGPRPQLRVVFEESSILKSAYAVDVMGRKHTASRRSASGRGKDEVRYTLALQTQLVH
jgi:hypothetical protein